MNKLLIIGNSRQVIDQIIDVLTDCDIEPKKISIIQKVRCSEENPIGFHKKNNLPVFVGPDAHNNWEKLWQKLDGAAILTMAPGGPLVFAGSFADRVIKAVNEKSIQHGFSAIGSILLNMKIAELDIYRCSQALRDFLPFIYAEGNSENLNSAKNAVEDKKLVQLASLY